MLIPEFQIERKEIAQFYLEYLRTHSFIKNRSVVLSFLKINYPNIYFQKKNIHEILHVLKHQIRFFCRFALATDVISYSNKYSGRVYKINNKNNLLKLEEKLNNLKNPIIKIRN